MRQARGIVPYAAFAVFIVGATIIALVATTLGVPVAAPEPPSPSPSAAPSVVRPVTDLSATAPTLETVFIQLTGKDLRE